ncbi:hypothetical protein T12_5425 [Trichinella patagoniensis]|uniref:Uncharacterized protein n=1 Tax=Trichinella patagoniensis TaxID=990121 RepID=A0A0V0ZRT8_9BILA|nr:hypothetical protein T12_5425 [Trichinella patagoniensis]
MGADRCPLVQPATTVASRLLMSVCLSECSIVMLHPSLNAALGLIYSSRRLVTCASSTVDPMMPSLDQQLPSARAIELPFQKSNQAATIAVVS